MWKIEINLARPASRGFSGSVVFTPGIPALGATEEPNLALIGGPQLPKPPLCGHVAAFRASDRGRRKGGDEPVVFDDGDLFFGSLSGPLHFFMVFDILDMTTFPAFELIAGGNHHALAMGTKNHRYLSGLKPD